MISAKKMKKYFDKKYSDENILYRYYQICFHRNSNVNEN